MSDTADVRIINTALDAIGQEPVSDLGESSLQRSRAAAKLVRHLETARETVLRRHGWLCALAYKTLTPVDLPAAVNWRYPVVYQLPGDALHVWEIEGALCDSWAPRWQLGTLDTDGGGATVVIRAQTTAASLNVAYVRRAAWAALDVHLRDAIAFDVAARGCYSVTGDVARASQVRKMAEEKVLLAISTEATQEGGQPEWAPSIPAALRAWAR